MSSPKHVGRTGSRWLRTAAAGGLARHRHRSVLRFLRTAGCRAPGSGPHPSSEPRGARLSRPSEAPTVSDRPVNRAPRPGRLRGSLTLALAICRHFVAAGDRQRHAAALLLFLATLALAAPAAAQITEVPGAPQNVTATGGDGVVLLEWDESPGGGTYQFRHALGSSVPESTNWLTARIQQNGISGYRWERTTGLTNGEAYAFEMRKKVGRNTSPTVSVTATPTAISCPAPDLTGRRQVWTGSVTMRSGRSFVGLYFYPADASIEVGPNNYEIIAATMLRFKRADSERTGRLGVSTSLGGPVPFREHSRLVLHVCDLSLSVREWVSYVNLGDYIVTVWTRAGLDWRFMDSRTLYLSMPGPGNTVPAFANTSETRSLDESVGDAVTAEDAVVDLGAPLAATDADDGILTYSLEGADSASFAIDAATGQLRSRAGVRYDHEAQSSYALTVTADDGNDGTASVDVTVEVTDVDEPPLAPAAPTVGPAPGSMTGLTVVWTAPSNTGRPEISSYDVRYRRGTSGDWTDGPQGHAGMSAMIAGLGESAPYEVQVRAVNAEGDGEWSEPGTGRTGLAAGALRVVGGGTANEGRLELYHGGQWGTVCDDYWGDEEADVACRALGYEDGSVDNATQFRRAFFGAGTGPILLDNVRCTGDETSLLACRHRGIGVNNCRHSEDVGVRCVASDPGPSVPVVPVVPVVSVRDAQGDEGGTLAFVVVLSSAAAVTVTVEYATSDGTAVADADYEAVSGTLVFGPGETQKTVAVSVLADTHSEAAETLTLTLAGPVGGTLGEAQATGTIAANVHGVPLTATLTHMPDEDEDDVLGEHKGSGTFEVRLAFNTEPELSYKTVRDTMFDVTGGTITGARRVTRRKNQHFDIVVKPSGNDAMTFSLHSPLPACGETGSVCTEAGRMVEGPVSATVLGPVAISVADATVREEEGATLAFAVTLDREREADVTVDYATSNGTATAGEDYVAQSGDLTFAAGETAKTVEVEVLDDLHDEGTETMTLTLSNPSGARIADATATGSIENIDPMPKAWMVRFGRTVGSQVVDALSARLDGGGSSHVTVAGINVMGQSGVEPEANADDPFGLPAWAANAEREADAQTITAGDILLRSAFHLSSGGQGAGAAPAFTTWGRVATGGFEAEVDDVKLDGDVTTGMVGFDAEWERALAGIMFSQSSGDGAYRLDPAKGDDAGTVESSLTGVYPYARVDLNAKVSAWALAGMGSGELTLHQEGGKPMPTDLSMRMGAVGVKGQVLDGSGPSRIGVNVKSDAMWVGTKSERTNDMVATEGDVTRVRLIVQGERVFVAGGATFTPSAEVGLRHDGGDAETGSGVEVGAGLSYIAGPLTIEGQVRMLVAHEESGYEEWGASGAIRMTPSASGRGLTLSIAPAWGRTGSATERLWSAHDARGLGADNEFEAGGQLAMDAGYGVGLPGNRGVLTPYAGMTLGDAGARTMRTGTRWQFNPDTVVSVEATRQASDGGETANELRLRAALRF